MTTFIRILYSGTTVATITAMPNPVKYGNEVKFFGGCLNLNLNYANFWIQTVLFCMFAGGEQEIGKGEGGNGRWLGVVVNEAKWFKAVSHVLMNAAGKIDREAEGLLFAVDALRWQLMVTMPALLHSNTATSTWKRGWFLNGWQILEYRIELPRMAIVGFEIVTHVGYWSSRVKRRMHYIFTNIYVYCVCMHRRREHTKEQFILFCANKIFIWNFRFDLVYTVPTVRRHSRDVSSGCILKC